MNDAITIALLVSYSTIWPEFPRTGNRTWLATTLHQWPPTNLEELSCMEMKPRGRNQYYLSYSQKVPSFRTTCPCTFYPVIMICPHIAPSSMKNHFCLLIIPGDRWVIRHLWVWLCAFVHQQNKHIYMLVWRNFDTRYLIWWVIEAYHHT